MNVTTISLEMRVTVPAPNPCRKGSSCSSNQSGQPGAVYEVLQIKGSDSASIYPAEAS
jgi:hypothetical protein